MLKKVFKQKFQLILVSLILILCAGFVFISCGIGSDPQLKTQDPDKGNYALDFGSCPGNKCRVRLENIEEFSNTESKKIEGKDLTIEAWVKSEDSIAANFNGGIISRFDTAGIALYVKNGIPKAVIRRVGASGAATATADYIANSNMAHIADQIWHHIAGVLTADDHTADHADCGNTTDTVDCTGATVCNDDIHLDIYVDGDYRDCNTTYGESNDSSVTAPAYTHEPGGHDLHVGMFNVSLSFDIDDIKTDNGGTQPTFNGIIDETRLWGVARSQAEINACMRTALGFSGTCSTVTDDLIAYHMFNEGEGEFTTDWAGLGSGSLLYDPEHLWLTGWTTDTPF